MSGRLETITSWTHCLSHDVCTVATPSPARVTYEWHCVEWLDCLPLIMSDGHNVDTHQKRRRKLPGYPWIFHPQQFSPPLLSPHHTPAGQTFQQTLPCYPRPKRIRKRYKEGFGWHRWKDETEGKQGYRRYFQTFRSALYMMVELTCLCSSTSSAVGCRPIEYQPTTSSVGNTCLTVGISL